jgi:hypothetical protein
MVDPHAFGVDVAFDRTVRLRRCLRDARAALTPVFGRILQRERPRSASSQTRLRFRRAVFGAVAEIRPGPPGRHDRAADVRAANAAPRYDPVIPVPIDAGAGHMTPLYATAQPVRREPSAGENAIAGAAALRQFGRVDAVQSGPDLPDPKRVAVDDVSRSAEGASCRHEGERDRDVQMSLRSGPL